MSLQSLESGLALASNQDLSAQTDDSLQAMLSEPQILLVYIVTLWSFTHSEDQTFSVSIPNCSTSVPGTGRQTACYHGGTQKGGCVTCPIMCQRRSCCLSVDQTGTANTSNIGSVDDLDDAKLQDMLGRVFKAHHSHCYIFDVFNLLFLVLRNRLATQPA